MPRVRLSSEISGPVITLSLFCYHCAMSLISFVGCVLLRICSALRVCHPLYLACTREWCYYWALLCLNVVRRVWHAFWCFVELPFPDCVYLLPLRGILAYLPLPRHRYCPFTVFCPRRVHCVCCDLGLFGTHTEKCLKSIFVRLTLHVDGSWCIWPSWAAMIHENIIFTRNFRTR